jgi:protein-tyrosine phosphatase
VTVISRFRSAERGSPQVSGAKIEAMNMASVSSPHPVSATDASPQDLIAAAKEVGIADADLPDPAHLVSRRLPLGGAFNLRDLGGYQTADGRTTMWQRVYRCDHMNTLADADLALISSLGLTRVHDFRLEKERLRQPSRVPAGSTAEVRLLNVGDAGTDETAVDVILDILAGRRPLPPPTFWDEGYLDMIDRARPMFVSLLTGLTELDPLPTVPGAPLPAMFHCTGGKDRTGLGAAFLLELLGVDRVTIMSDFLATNVYRTPSRAVALADQLASVGITISDALPILGVTRSALTGAWNAIDAEHGNVHGYLVAAGLDPSVPELLRSTLLV